MRPHFLPRAIVAMLLVLAMTGGAWAQGNPTGTVAGRVSGQDGAALPGVTVTATSPNLQGPRTVVTNEVGDYIIPFLPPGEYTLTYELQGFQGANQKTLVTGAATVPVDAKLQVGGVNEAITVTGAVTEAFTPGVAASTTLKQELVNELPLNRGLDQTIALTPGALRTGPSNSNTGNQQIALSGAITSENLILVNGVVAQDNVRRTSLPLFIEDALQETTISTAGVSAEFGRFCGRHRQRDHQVGRQRVQRLVPDHLHQRRLAGGHAARRRSRRSTAWCRPTSTPSADRSCAIACGSSTPAATRTKSSDRNLFAPVNSAYTRQTLRRRFEGKGTYSPFTGHTARVSYLNNYARAAEQQLPERDGSAAA